MILKNEERVKTLHLTVMKLMEHLRVKLNIMEDFVEDKEEEESDEDYDKIKFFEDFVNKRI